MILKDEAITGLSRWLEATPEEELWRIPIGVCTCSCCQIYNVLSLPITGEVFVDIYPAVELAIKLYNRFGQCDLDLLKELYEKEVVEANG